MSDTSMENSPTTDLSPIFTLWMTPLIFSQAWFASWSNVSARKSVASEQLPVPEEMDQHETVFA